MQPGTHKYKLLPRDQWILSLYGINIPEQKTEENVAKKLFTVERAHQPKNNCKTSYGGTSTLKSLGNETMRYRNPTLKLTSEPIGLSEHTINNYIYPPLLVTYAYLSESAPSSVINT